MRVLHLPPCLSFWITAHQDLILSRKQKFIFGYFRTGTLLSEDTLLASIIPFITVTLKCSDRDGELEPSPHFTDRDSDESVRSPNTSNAACACEIGQGALPVLANNWQRARVMRCPSLPLRRLGGLSLPLNPSMCVCLCLPPRLTTPPQAMIAEQVEVYRRRGWWSLPAAAIAVGFFLCTYILTCVVLPGLDGEIGEVSRVR